MTEIKRIIFDLDNTLINWKKEYSNGFLKTLKDFNLDYSENDDRVVAYYESTHSNYNKVDLLKCFNEFTGLNVTMDFIDAWQDNLGLMADEDPKVNDVLDYLSKKYELVVLTNWFKAPQEKRLETARMRQYFIEVIGGDDYKKPDPRCFKKAIGHHKPNECIMIGDNLEEDIKAALSVGLKAIYLSKENENGIKTIENLSELKAIL